MEGEGDLGLGSGEGAARGGAYERYRHGGEVRKGLRQQWQSLRGRGRTQRKGWGNLGAVRALQRGVQCLLLRWGLVAPRQEAASLVTALVSPGVRPASQFCWLSLGSQSKVKVKVV